MSSNDSKIPAAVSESRPLRIALACGGTGGHIFPGLATAEVLRERGHDVTLWLAGKDVESAAVKNWTGPVVTIAARGLPTRPSWRVLPAVWSLLRARRACRLKMRVQPPDVLLAMGSYASVGPVSAALHCGVPVVLHEANVVPGRMIKMFAHRAQAVAVSFEASRFYLQDQPVTVTGMPIRRDLERAARTLQCGSHGAPFTVMVLGGSRGAHRLNEVASAAVCALPTRQVPVRVFHLTGPADEGNVRRDYTRAGVEHRVYAFTTEMAALYAETNLAVCRSGASTCAELLAFGVPALLVPYPFAASNHQHANALAMERMGAADYITEADLSTAWLTDYIAERCQTRDRLARMSAAGRAHQTQSGAEALADLVIKTGRGNHA